MANDLNNMVPSPLSELPVAKPPSIEVMKCIPAGAESDTNSSIVDSGDEWDKTETVGPSRSSTPTMKIGPTWADVHAAAQEEEMAKSQAPSWGDLINTTPQGRRKLGRGQPVCRGRPIRRCCHRRSLNTNWDRGKGVRQGSGGRAAHATR